MVVKYSLIIQIKCKLKGGGFLLFWCTEHTESHQKHKHFLALSEITVIFFKDGKLVLVMFDVPN